MKANGTLTRRSCLQGVQTVGAGTQSRIKIRMSCPWRHHGCVVFVFIGPFLICRRVTVSNLLLFFSGLQPQTWKEPSGIQRLSAQLGDHPGPHPGQPYNSARAETNGATDAAAPHRSSALGAGAASRRNVRHIHILFLAVPRRLQHRWPPSALLRPRLPQAMNSIVLKTGVVML